MRPVQFSLFLQFATEIYAYSHSQKILKTLGVKVSRPETLPERGVRLKLDKDKVSVMWQPSLCHIAIENVSNSKYCIDTIMSFLEEIGKVAPIGEIRTRRFITYWILPAPNYNFASLERKYRDMMIVENDISNAAYDSSVILDISADKWTLHHQSGPMAPPQLLQTYLRFTLDNLPKTFIFLETTILDSNVVQYSRQEMHTFMAMSLEHCISHSKAFEKLWEGHL